MSDESGSGFGVRTVIILIVAGVVCFGAFLVLGAYAPEMRSGRDGRGHALSSSAVGFRGVHDLLFELGYDVEFVRDPNALGRSGLLIAAIDPMRSGGDVEAIIERGETRPTLIVLPKWVTMPEMGRDRVRSVGPFAANMASDEIDDIGPINVSGARSEEGDALRAPAVGERIIAPEALQAIRGKALVPLIETDAGDIILANIEGTELYILADPDLINNQALDSEERAAAALAILTELGENGDYRFDLTLAGFGGGRNLLKLAFEPPFLALTLCIVAAALLAGYQAAFRFGAARREPRAIAFGKRALVDNSADLIRVTRRERLSAERYVGMTRDAAVAAIGNPRRLEGEALDGWLDKFTRGEGEPFTALAARAEAARSRHEILEAARALHLWRRTVTHDRVSHDR